MKAIEILQHFMKVGTWVDWENTTDGFHFGNPDMTVSGIAVGWKPYWQDLTKAKDLGCNLFLSHESIFKEGGIGDETGQASPLEMPKLKWLEQSAMAVYRCHDVWDVMPQIGVRDSWAAGLGFTATPLKISGYYRLEDVAGHTFQSLCDLIAEKVKSTGQEAILAVGDAGRKVSRLALGTGAITKPEEMLALGADVIIVCDDYFRFVRDGALISELDIPYIMMNHGALEEWGIENLFAYAKKHFSGVPVHFFRQGCPYIIIG